MHTYMYVGVNNRHTRATVSRETQFANYAIPRFDRDRKRATIFADAMLVVLLATTSFAPQLVAHACPRSCVPAPHYMNAATLTLPTVSDDTFEEIVMSTGNTLILEFAADYCGPCKMVEPVLSRFNQKHSSLDVFKAKLDQNHNLRVLLMKHGVKIAALPTLVLLRDGAPVRTLFGARDILAEEKLHAFAFDEDVETLPPGGAEPGFSPANLFSQIGAKLGLSF